jgi:beta-glucosidase
MPAADVEAGKSVVVTVDVRNTGTVAGDEVVELYLTQPKGFETPLRELVGFQRVHAVPTAGARVTFTIDPRSLGQVDEAGNRKILPGEYAVWIGGSQPGDGGAGVSAKFSVVGTAELPK